MREKLDAAPVAAVRAELSDAERKEVRRALTALAQDLGEPRAGLTLYHALGLSGVTRDVAEMSRRHAQLESDNNKRRRDNTRVVHQTVLVIAKRILIDGDPRAYEESLVAEVQDELAAKGFRAAFDDGVIDEAEAEQLTRRGVELGLSQELARRVVAQIARDNGVPLHTGASVDYLVCGACGAVTARERAGERCESCGAELLLECPNGDCGEVNDASAGRCRKCGTDLHEYTAAMRRLPELERMIRDGRLQQAADELTLAQRALGEHEQLAPIARELTSATERAQAEWSEAERAISRRELYAARGALQRLRASAGDLHGPESLTPAERLMWVNERLREVEEALLRARGESGREREAILAGALAIAADCREAGKQLDGIPASPSPAVRVALRGAEVLIEWDPSPTVGVAYELVRVHSDGSRVELGGGPLSACETVDSAVESGAVVRYELLAVRGASRSASVASEPLLVARELQQFEVFSGDAKCA